MYIYIQLIIWDVQKYGMGVGPISQVRFLEMDAPKGQLAHSLGVRTARPPDCMEAGTSYFSSQILKMDSPDGATALGEGAVCQPT